METAINHLNISETIQHLEANHQEFREKTLPEIEMLFHNALKNKQTEQSVIFLSKMFQNFKEHFIYHMECEENELFKNINPSITTPHDDIPDNLLLAIEKSIETLNEQKKSDLVLKHLHQKILAFQEQLNIHSEIEKRIFGH